MSDPPPSKVKASIVRVLMRLSHRRPCLAMGLAKVIVRLWPGFKER